MSESPTTTQLAVVTASMPKEPTYNLPDIEVRWASERPNTGYLVNVASGTSHMWRPTNREQIAVWLRAGRRIHWNPAR